MFNRANSTRTIRILAFVITAILGLSQFTSYGTLFSILSTQNIYGENATSSAPVYDDFSDGVYTLEQGKMSPNSNWFGLWDGDGSMGVKQMHDGNNVLFLEPMPSTESSETRSAIVLSALEYKDFVLSLDVMTERQLRQNTPPNPWEVAWVIWRWQDDTHFYYFNVGFDASEVGKYDGGQNPQDQKFLVSTETITAGVGQWTHWDIMVRGDHIAVEVDGARIFDFEDTSSFDTGKVGLYTEDAAVVFDNIKITPTMAGDDYIGDANRYQYVFTCTQYDVAFQCDDSIPDNSEKVSFPVQVDSTNIRIAGIEYFERQEGNKMTINLEDERGRSSVSLRLQNSIFNKLNEDSSFVERETSLANDGKTIVELPHSVRIESSANYETITLQLPNDYTNEDKLQLIISESEVSVTKTVPEFGMPAVILIILISATTIYSMAAKKYAITN